MAVKPSVRDLSSEGKKIFRQLVHEYGIEDAAGQRILLVACQAFDRAQQARAAINRDGLMLPDRHGQRRQHPLLTVERDARAGFLAGLKALNLDLEALKPVGRPPGR